MKYSTVSYLAHHGVEGQKWGVRRWQNKDGSLTPEGRVHYGIGDADIANAKRSISSNYKKNGKVKREAASNMLAKKNEFIRSNMNKISNDNTGYDYYRNKFYKRWDKENKNKSDEDIENEFGGDMDGLINDGYGSTAKEAAREWDWVHGISDEWDEWANQRDTDNVAKERARAEVLKVADEIYGSDKMLKKAERGNKATENVLLAIGGTVFVVGAGTVIANKADAKKHGGEGFLDRWAKDEKR